MTKGFRIGGISGILIALSGRLISSDYAITSLGFSAEIVKLYCYWYAS